MDLWLTGQLETVPLVWEISLFVVLLTLNVLDKILFSLMSSEKKMRQNCMNALVTLDYSTSSNDFLIVLYNIGTCIYTAFTGRQQNEVVAEDKTKRCITHSPQKSLFFFPLLWALILFSLLSLTSIHFESSDIRFFLKLITFKVLCGKIWIWVHVRR